MTEEPSAARASDEYLRELGLLTIRWANLEAYIDLLCAYLSHRTDSQKVPRPFKQRLKYIRKQAKHRAMIVLRSELHELAERSGVLGQKRNDVAHGIVVAWETGEMAKVFSLKEEDGAYQARLDQNISLQGLVTLNADIDAVARRLFGMLERVKAIFRFLDGDERFLFLDRLDGDRGQQ